MQSGLRGPERVRGRVHSQMAVSSVLPVAAVVIVVGGLFWISIWLVLRTPTSARPAPTAANAAVDVATPVANGQDDNAYDYFADGDDGPGIAAVQADKPAVAAIGSASDDEVGTTDQPTAVASTDSTPVPGSPRLVALGPLQGPNVPDGFVLGDAVADAGATDQTSSDQVADAAEVSVRAAEVSVRAAELTAQAADLTARLEGAAAKIDELQARLDASSAALAARPTAVPSPVAVAAAQPRSTDANARATGRASAASVAAASAATASSASAATTAGTRAPWVVLPQPSPGTRVTAGPLVLETRARGEAPITEIRLQLDGVALSVALDRRDDTTWRGRSTTRVGPGSHTVAVAVVDGQGRVGSYRWQFDASPS